MVYSATNELVSVAEVHPDEPNEAYYTVAMADGRERETLLTTNCNIQLKIN